MASKRSVYEPMKKWNAGICEYWVLDASFHDSNLSLGGEARPFIDDGLSGIKFAATHKEMAAGIGTDKAAFLIDKLGAAHGTQLPPVFLPVLFCRFGSIHHGSSMMIISL